MMNQGTRSNCIKERQLKTEEHKSKIDDYLATSIDQHKQQVKFWIIIFF